MKREKSFCFASYQRNHSTSKGKHVVKYDRLIFYFLAIQTV